MSPDAACPKAVKAVQAVQNARHLHAFQLLGELIEHWHVEIAQDEGQVLVMLTGDHTEGTFVASAATLCHALVKAHCGDGETRHA